MVVRNGEKWACARCIRGHRVSSCQHEDRELQHVAKKGRPISQCAHCRHMRKVSRSAHVRCDCGERPTKCEHLQRPLDGHKGTCCCNHGGECSCSGRKRRSQPSIDDALASISDDGQSQAIAAPPRRRRRATTTTTTSSSSSATSLALEDLDGQSDRRGSSSPQLTPLSANIFDSVTQSFMTAKRSSSESVSSGSSSLVDLHDSASIGRDMIPPRSQTESPFSSFHSPSLQNAGLQLDMSAIRDFSDVLASPFSNAEFSPTRSTPLHSAALNCAFDPTSLFLMSSFASLHDPVDVLTPTTPLTPPDIATSLPSMPAVVGHESDAILWPHGPGASIGGSGSSELMGMGRLWDLDGSFEWAAGHVAVDLEPI